MLNLAGIPAEPVTEVLLNTRLSAESVLAFLRDQLGLMFWKLGGFLVSILETRIGPHIATPYRVLSCWSVFACMKDSGIL